MDRELGTMISGGRILTAKLKMVIMGGKSTVSREVRGVDGQSGDTNVSMIRNSFLTK